MLGRWLAVTPLNTPRMRASPGLLLLPPPPQSLGDDDEGGVESSSATLMETEEGYQVGLWGAGGGGPLRRGLDVMLGLCTRRGGPGRGM